MRTTQTSECFSTFLDFFLRQFTNVSIQFENILIIFTYFQNFLLLDYTLPESVEKGFLQISSVGGDFGSFLWKCGVISSSKAKCLQVPRSLAVQAFAAYRGDASCACSGGFRGPPRDFAQVRLRCYANPICVSFDHSAYNTCTESGLINIRSACYRMVPD